jgi:hypothetical protein
MRQSLVIVAGDTEGGVWCVPCNAPVAVRVPLHIGDLGSPPAALITVCAACGNRSIPHIPSVTITPPPRRMPRPWLAIQWRAQRRDCARRGVTLQACAMPGCPRPGWWDCAWFQAVDDGRIRWLFCGAKHRREWLELNGHAPRMAISR